MYKIDISPFPIISGTPDNDFFIHLHLQATESANESTSSDPMLVVVFPASVGNPYQALIYSRASDHGAAVVGLSRLEDLPRIQWWGPIALHVHWFGHITRSCANEGEALNDLESSKRYIIEFLQRTGAALFWTAHNVLPHDTQFVAPHLDFRRWLVDTASEVLVHEEHHVNALEEAYAVELASVSRVPHPLYSGVYPDWMTRSSARARLGAGKRDFVVSCVGSLQPYKGTDTVLHAINRMRRNGDDNIRGICAGKPVSREYKELLYDLSWPYDCIDLYLQSIPPETMQRFMLASDLVILPYENSINSGVAFLAATFGVKFLISRNLAFQDLRDLGGLEMEDTDIENVVSGIGLSKQSLSVSVDEGRRTEALARRQPRTVSNQLFNVFARHTS